MKTRDKVLSQKDVNFIAIVKFPTISVEVLGQLNSLITEKLFLLLKI